MGLRRGRGDERSESDVGEVEGEGGVLRRETSHDDDGEGQSWQSEGEIKWLWKRKRLRESERELAQLEKNMNVDVVEGFDKLDHGWTIWRWRQDKRK